jgi:zinc protease
MKKLYLLVFLLLQFPLTGISQQNLPSNYFFTTLPNGLEVLVVEDHETPLATIEINVKNGSYTEPPEYSGLSHFYEHMFFKANKDIPSQEEYIKKMSSLGMIWNGTTSVNRVNYFFTLPSYNIEEGLKFMNSAIRYPLFLEDEIKKEQLVVNGEFQRDESNPEFHLWDELGKKMFGDMYCRKNPIGDHAIILSATTEKMQVIQKKYYWPNNSLLIIGGDVDHSAVFEKVNSIYGDWLASGFDPFTKWPIPEFKQLKEDITFIKTNENAGNPEIAMSWFGPDTRKDIAGTYAADVFGQLVSLEASKFQKDLVDSGLAYNANMSYETDKFSGTVYLFVMPNPNKLKECIEKVQEHIKMWSKDDYFTDEQLETAKKKLIIRQEYQTEKTSSFVHTLGFWWAVAGLDYAVNYADNINKVNRKNIKSFLNKYITDMPKVSGILMSPGLEQTLKIKSFNDLVN